MLKIFAFFLQFLVLNYGTFSNEMNVESFPPTQAPALSPPLFSPPPPLLVDQDVNAVNALLRLYTMSGDVMDTRFSATDCLSNKFKPSIRCNCTFEKNTACRVTHINLASMNLRGWIPEEIGNLTYLRSLDLSSNKLCGMIPESFVKLSRLSGLNLCKNNLKGPVPHFLAKMKLLQSLYLCDNGFNESIPGDLGNLTSLIYLNMRCNLLSGIIPYDLGNLTSLIYLNMRSNLLSGRIPYDLGNLTSLMYLNMRNNLLSGRIPYELGNISSLEELYLQNNQLSGPLPEQLGNLTNLQQVNMMNNLLTGPIPPSFQNLRNLQDFNIRGNDFNGPIPEFIANWQTLLKLILEGNNFDVPLPAAITGLTSLNYLSINDLDGGGQGFSFPEVKSSANLRSLILRNCSLTGPIPDFIWKLPYLCYLDLSFNNLTGGIPLDFNPRFLNYECIFLRSNKLTQTFPGWLTNSNLSNVDVSENFFTNVTISTANISSNMNLFSCCSNISVKGMKWLETNYYCDNDSLTYDHLYINCGGNATSINGSNYEADVQKDGASTFFLSYNKAWAYSSMGTFINTGRRQYIVSKTCNISMVDAPLYKEARVSPISLKYYGFCLKNGNYTLRLHFAEIGWDETKDSNIKRRRVFDVDVQGGQYYLKDFNIEEEAGGVDKDITKEFNITVSDRRLEIHLYWSGKGSTSAPTKYYGPLISAISLSPVLKRHRKLPLPSATIGGIAASATLFVILELAIFWKLGWLGGKTSRGEAIELYPGGIFYFHQIKEATKNFNPDNKIGEGGFGTVYKGVLPNGTQVAVKQLSAKSKQGAREFMNEIATTYALQHPNLVKLMGCCVEQNELLLVYEYMENNSLNHALFGPAEVKSRLTWLTRVRICRDVAQGLAFLHEESKLKIIHRDIKPTNVLLDKDFNAKISDFGYAQLNEEDHTRVITKIAGTTGYMAPENYLEGLLTPKVDVYSFGIVTLEIISGKKIRTIGPNNQTIYLLDTAYAYQEQRNLIALLDRDLGSDYTYSQALEIVKLAMECVSHAPTQRPSMSEVVKVLEGILKVEESKRKRKTVSTSSTTPSVDDPTIVNPVSVSSQSTQSGSTSQDGGPSVTTISLPSSKEIEYYSSTSADL